MAINRKIIINLSIVVLVLLTLLLMACNEVTPTLPNPVPTFSPQIGQASPTPNPNVEPAIGNCSPNNTTYRIASRAYVSAEDQVKQSKQIFLGQVSKLGNLVWTSPDGTAPKLNNPNAGISEYEQLAPVEYTILEVYLGNLKPGDKFTMLKVGAPCAKPINYPGISFPLLGEKRILMIVSDNSDYRRGKGVTPLISPAGYELILQADGTWRDIDPVTIDQIKDIVKNLPPNHTPLPLNYGSPAKSVTASAPLPTPTPTPFVSGQTLNLADVLQLSKTQMFRINSGTVGRTILDDQIIKQVLATLDKPLPLVDRNEAWRLIKPGEPGASFWFEWVENGFHSTVQLHYYFDSKVLMVMNKDIQVQASPELVDLLGLKPYRP
jgi:hypothetical protein